MSKVCALDTFVNFMNQAKGRDKLFRTFQYLRLLCIPLIVSKDSKSGIFLTKFGDTCSTFRKILRIFKVILNTKSSIDKIKVNGLKLSVVFDCLSSLSESLYCLVDHIILINKINAYKFSDGVMSFVNFQENFLWLCETIFGIIADSYKYADLLKEEAQTDNKEHIQIMKNKLFVNQLRLWSDFFVSYLI